MMCAGLTTGWLKAEELHVVVVVVVAAVVVVVVLAVCMMCIGLTTGWLKAEELHHPGLGGGDVIDY